MVAYRIWFFNVRRLPKNFYFIFIKTKLLKALLRSRLCFAYATANSFSFLYSHTEASANNSPFYYSRNMP